MPPSPNCRRPAKALSIRHSRKPVATLGPATSSAHHTTLGELQKLLSKLPRLAVAAIQRSLVGIGLQMVLNRSRSVEDMNLPGFRLHGLKGNLRGFYAVTVRANYRVIFRFEDGHAFDVDLTD
jgi:plasmid maintenance system killer protein